MSAGAAPAIRQTTRAEDRAGVRTGTAAPGALLGRAAVLIWNDVLPEGRDQFYRWHDGEHIPERMALPGFRRGRRFVCPGHSPEWLTLYEADSVAALTSPEYLDRLNQPTPATRHSLQFFQNTSRAVCTLAATAGTSTGGYILALRIDAPAEVTQRMCGLVSGPLFLGAMERTGVLACHLFSSDQAASHIDTAESNTREFDVPSWVILCEATSRPAAEAAQRALLCRELLELGVAVRPDVAVYALEICRMGTYQATPAESEPDVNTNVNQRG